MTKSLSAPVGAIGRLVKIRVETAGDATAAQVQSPPCFPFWEPEPEREPQGERLGPQEPAYLDRQPVVVLSTVTPVLETVGSAGLAGRTAWQKGSALGSEKLESNGDP